MFQRFYSRVARLSLVTAALLLPITAIAATTSTPRSPLLRGEACDRTCLRQVLDAYMNGVFKHAPETAMLSGGYIATEDTLPVLAGDGAWKSVTGYGQSQHRYFDPYQQTAAFVGSVIRNGNDTLVSVRIAVEDRRVVEAEWVWGLLGAGNRGEATPEGMVEHPIPEVMLPAGERTSRFMMKALALAYMMSIKEHDGSWVPRTAECRHMRNGGGTLAPPPPFARRQKCGSDFELGRAQTKDMSMQRLLVVDEEAGVIMAASVMIRYPGAKRMDVNIHMYFVIRENEIDGIWTVTSFLPWGSRPTSGWEDR